MKIIARRKVMSSYKYKQVIIIRKDLKMRQGKAIAQGAHASLTAIFNHANLASRSFTDEWLKEGQAKICVYVESEEELISIHRLALNNKLPTALITDAGHTEFHGLPTKTAVAIGPGPSDIIDKITGHLKLL